MYYNDTAPVYQGAKTGPVKDLRSFSVWPKPLTAEEKELQVKLCFAYTRLRAVNAILAYDNGGPCLTDDGIVYFDLMLPYAIEASELGPECAFDAAFRRMKYWMPNLLTELGPRGFADRWDAMSDLRSTAESRHRIKAKVGHVDWLPTAERIRTETRLTRAKHTAINALYPDKPPLLGIGVIDPLTEDQKREANKLRMRAVRREQGAIPQADRNKGANDKAIATIVGCDPKTIQRHRLGNTLLAYLESKGPDVLKVCIPYIEKKGCAQIQDIALTDPYSEGMAILTDILSDPYVWDAELV